MLILMRTVNGCNMHCDYCYGNYGQNVEGLNSADCSVLLRVLRDMDLPGNKVEFLWHGGEPTLLDPDEFVDMLELLNSLGSESVEVSHSMQSNGLALTGDWTQVLAKYRVGVGISLDGPQHLHDYARKSPDGEPTYARIHENIQHLLASGVKVSLLCTLGLQHENKAEEIVTWLAEMDLPVKFNPLFAKGRCSRQMPLGKYYLLLREIFCHLLKLGSAPPVQPFEWMLRSILYRIPPAECSFSGNCGKNIFSFGKGCKIGICTRDSDVYGDLKTSSLTGIIESHKWQTRCRARRSGECGKCSALPYCHGGCPAVRQEGCREEDCAAIRDFFTWLAGDGLDLYRDALVSRKRSLSLMLDQMKAMKPGFGVSDV